MNKLFLESGDFLWKLLESRTNLSMDYYCRDPTVGPEVVNNPFIYIVDHLIVGFLSPLILHYHVVK